MTTRLTPREADVYLNVISGLPNKAIATKLGIKVKTVKWNMTKIMKKYGVNNRSELIIKFYNEEKKKLKLNLER